MSKTVRVRIAVLVTPSGSYNAAGYRCGTDDEGPTDPELVQEAYRTMPSGWGDALAPRFIEATVPAFSETIEGEVVG